MSACVCVWRRGVWLSLKGAGQPKLKRQRRQHVNKFSNYVRQQRPKEMPTNWDPSPVAPTLPPSQDTHTHTPPLQSQPDAATLHNPNPSRILTQDLFPFKSCVEKFAAAVGSKRQESNVWGPWEFRLNVAEAWRSRHTTDTAFILSWHIQIFLLLIMTKVFGIVRFGRTTSATTAARKIFVMLSNGLLASDKR